MKSSNLCVDAVSENYGVYMDDKYTNQDSLRRFLGPNGKTTFTRPSAEVPLLGGKWLEGEIVNALRNARSSRGIPFIPTDNSFRFRIIDLGADSTDAKQGPRLLSTSLVPSPTLRACVVSNLLLQNVEHNWVLAEMQKRATIRTICDLRRSLNYMIADVKLDHSYYKNWREYSGCGGFCYGGYYGGYYGDSYRTRRSYYRSSRRYTPSYRVMPWGLSDPWYSTGFGLSGFNYHNNLYDDFGFGLSYGGFGLHYTPYYSQPLYLNPFRYAFIKPDKIQEYSKATDRANIEWLKGYGTQLADQGIRDLIDTVTGREEGMIRFINYRVRLEEVLRDSIGLGMDSESDGAGSGGMISMKSERHAANDILKKQLDEYEVRVLGREPVQVKSQGTGGASKSMSEDEGDEYDSDSGASTIIPEDGDELSEGDDIDEITEGDVLSDEIEAERQAETEVGHYQIEVNAEPEEAEVPEVQKQEVADTVNASAVKPAAKQEEEIAVDEEASAEEFDSVSGTTDGDSAVTASSDIGEAITTSTR